MRQRTVYVTAEDADTDPDVVVPNRVHTNTTEQPIKVGCGPTGIAITPSGRTAFVVNQCGSSPTCSTRGSVTAINLRTHTTHPSVKVGMLPLMVAFSPDGRTAYITNQGGDTGPGSVTPITIATDTSKRAIPVPGPSGIVITP